MNSNGAKINAWFAGFEHRMDSAVPGIIAETANEYFKESFTRKGWDNSPWAPVKKANKRGTLMVRSAKLVDSIRPSTVSPGRIVISAGSSKVPYARIHNEGGLISRAARSETFLRNRQTSGKGKGRFKRGTTAGQGFSFSASSYNMPQRQFMGHSAILNKRIITRIKQAFNSR